MAVTMTLGGVVDLQDRALLLNPDGVQALLDAVALQHTTHAVGGMAHCDRAVCRLADQINPADFVGGDDRYYEQVRDDGYDDGHREGYEAGFEAGEATGRAKALQEHRCHEISAL
jgi:hypothetical protein